MLVTIRRFFNLFFNRSRTINNEPLNKVSLIVIVLIDVFILFNVFQGLDDISGWHISPFQAYPCYEEWQDYQTQNTKDKDYDFVKSSVSNNTYSASLAHTYQQVQENHLGHVSDVCIKYAEFKDKINNSENQQTIKTIGQKQERINTLEQTNRDIRHQYDSTLLEKIANQDLKKSIYLVRAEKAKQELDQNNLKIAALNQENTKLKNELVAKPESVAFLAFLHEEDKFREVEKGYQSGLFWYASLQLAFQSFFLLPLILITLSIHNLAQRRGYGLVSLISWHLLVIFFIPLIFKVFEFLQIGAIFQFLFDIISALFKGLLFLINYVYILLIPLIGFGVIKFSQKVIFNTKLQAANRMQNSRCLRCAKKIRHHDTYCPHCGYYQYIECSNCHDFTYKHLPYCKQCGYSQNSR